MFSSKEEALKFKLSRPWVERARPDLEQEREYYEIKISGYDRSNPSHKGPQMQALEFAYQLNYWKPITHFLYIENEKKWYVFSMKEALKNVKFIRHIPECNPPENITILNQLLPDVKIYPFPRSWSKNASNNDNVVLDLDRIKLNNEYNLG